MAATPAPVSETPISTCAERAETKRAVSRRPFGSEAAATSRERGDTRLHAGGITQQCRLIRRFPRELGLLPAEVPVGGGLGVDRPEQVEHLHDALRTKV